MKGISVRLKLHPDTDEQVKAHVNIMYTANWLSNYVSGVLKPHGLSHEQYNVLRILRGKHPECMTQKDVLSRMIAPQSNLTFILRRLESKKLIVVGKSDSDRREYRIFITEYGLEILLQIDKDMAIRMESIRNLTVSESFQLNELLDKLRGDE
jgi:DNA-binding MarR family transcriptional regulator